MMDGGQSPLMLKSVMTGWRELVATSRQARVIEKLKEENPAQKLKEENPAYKAKSDETMRRAMSMMMGVQASLVVRGAFTDGEMRFRS